MDGFRQCVTRPRAGLALPAAILRGVAAGVLALAMAAGPGASRARAVGYTITDLGSLGGDRTLPAGMNNLGQVVGISNIAPADDADFRGFLYDQTGMHDLNAVLGNPNAFPSGIGDGGQLEGALRIGYEPQRGQINHAFLFDGALHDLGTLPGGSTSSAYLINARGHIAGAATIAGDRDPPQHAFLYDEAGMHDLGTLPGYSQSIPTAMNASDQIVGQAGPQYWSRSRAFLWKDGRMQDLGSLGGTWSYAAGINDAGQVVGRAAALVYGSERQHAFLYDSTGMHDLGTIAGPSPWWESGAWGINNRGQVVGTSDTRDEGTHLFLYSDGVMKDLYPLFLDHPTWEIFHPVAINDPGQILVCGIIGGKEHAYLVSPVPTPQLHFSAGSLDFGSQPAGTTSDARTLLVTNDGELPLTVDGISLSGPAAPLYAIVGDSGETKLAPGESRTLQITFSPAAEGPRTASVIVHDNDLRRGTSHRVALSGTGTVPALTLTPAERMDFGSQRVGVPSDAASVSIANTGQAPLVIRDVQIIGAAAGDFSATDLAGATIAPGESRAIGMRFTPTARRKRGAVLVITDNAPGSPHRVDLSGTGIAPVLRPRPTALDFGPQPVGLNASLAVLLQNTGDAPLLIGSIAIQGPNAAEFALASGDESGETLDPGDITLLNVRFSPTMTGARGARLVIPSDAADNPQSVPLTGTGTAPLLRLSADSLLFSLQPGDPGATQTLTFTNNGDAPLTIDRLTLAGPDAGSFHLVSDSGQKSLDPGASRTVKISFSPASIAGTGSKARITAAPIAAARYSATLEVHHNDPHPSSPHQIKLTAAESAPAAPTKLMASLTPANQIALTWRDNSGNETAFAVWRQSGGGPSVRVGVLPPNTTGFTDAGVSPNTRYTYQVRATNNTGASEWSNKVSALTLEALPAAPRSLKATVVSAREIDLSWVVGGGNETGIAIFRQSNAGQWERIGVVAPRTSRYADRSVKPGTSYRYRVRAHNNHYPSDWTNAGEGRTPSR
jgi:probable HAF family extracellular repeat protein